MKKLIVISLLISLPVFVWAVVTQKFDLRNKAADNTPVVPTNRCPSEETRNIVKAIWEYQKPILAENIKKSFENKDTYVLYGTQVYTNNLLEMAAECLDTQTLGEIIDLYLVPYQYLQTTPKGHTAWLCDTASCAGYHGTPLEEPHSDSQFIYTLSRTIDILTDLPPESLTPQMHDFLQKYIPYITEQLHVWISDPEYVATNQMAYLDCKLRKCNKDIFSNTIPDTSMWMIAISARLLSADKKSDLVTLSPDQQKELQDHVDLGTRLIQSRLTETNLTNFSGQPVNGLTLDSGFWKDFADDVFCGYTGDTFPTSANISKCDTATWDISHARRFVHVFNTLYSARPATGQAFPDESVLTKLANQLAYKIFNGSFTRPLFSNYWDGNNGWYRVDYAGSTGFAYAPYDLSISVPTGGYGLWGKYNPDIDRIIQSVWSAIDSIDPETVAFRNTHYGTMYSNYQHSSSNTSAFSKTTSLNLLMMLPTMTNFTTTPTSSPTSSPEYIHGDLNHNGHVDLFDYNTMITHFGKTGTPGFISADINSDGKVDIFDYSKLIENFGK